ncbi:MAG: hypothetical protein CMJ19_15945 [Phycisphaeraceae bacterium]|nr:hypothetical protein [Phycisphaeraceae bacterium]
MTVPEVDALFALADMARKESDIAEGIDEPDEEDDSAALFANPVHRIRTGKPTYTELPDGDVHVCFGTQCPHAELDKERNWVCSLTGNVIGIDPKRGHDDGWTGRSVGSSNPDDAAGTPVGGWIKRRDMFQASVDAWNIASGLSTAQPSAAAFASSSSSNHKPATAAPRSERASAKRGALCVDEAAGDNEAANAPRQPQQAKQYTRHGIDKLLSEAGVVIGKLFIVDETEAAAPSAAPTAAEPKRQKLDPRLQNPEFVRAAALKRYARECGAGKAQLNLDVLHNVCVHANEFVRKQRLLAKEETATPAVVVRGRSRPRAAAAGHVRHMVARLIVHLWRAACLTPHMRDNKKGNDSFRPFAAGILYSFKRGLYLSDGTCVVPELASLAASLPALRSAQSTAAAKQLQSSSHRGICSFHRSISSVAQMPEGEAQEVQRLFASAAELAATLRELVANTDG